MEDHSERLHAIRTIAGIFGHMAEDASDLFQFLYTAVYDSFEDSIYAIDLSNHDNIDTISEEYIISSIKQNIFTMEENIEIIKNYLKDFEGIDNKDKP